MRLNYYYQKYISKKNKAVSPVIAVVMLIGLTVLSGAMLFAITDSFLNDETDVNLSIVESSTVFKTTETDYITADELIDTLSIQIQNPLEVPILIELTQTFLYNATDDSKLPNWAVDTDVSEIVLNGKESEVITFFTNIDSSELTDGDQVYVVFKSKLYGSENELTSLKSSTFTVQLTNQLPLFQVIPVISGSQTEDTLYFSGEDDDVVKQSLTIAIFNFGNAEESHAKSVSITLENDTIFSVEDGYSTQFVTVPSAEKGGDFGVEGFCESGEACVVLSFPITKHNLTEVNITNLDSSSFGAIITVSGLDFITYKFDLTNPEFKIDLQNDKKKGVRYNTITFDEKPDKDKEIKFDVRVWNLMTYDNNGTFEIYDFNTTVFELEEDKDKGKGKGKLDSNPTSLMYFNPGPAKDYDKCRSRDGCKEITWSLIRKPLVDKNGESLGIEPGTYTAQIRELRTGQIKDIQLIIPEYIYPIHVESMELEEKKKDKFEVEIEIRDSDGNVVKDAEVTITWQKPDGSTKTITEKTDKKGMVTFKFDVKKLKGDHIITVDDVEKTSKGKKGEFLWPYDADANKVTTITVKIN